MAIFRLSKLTFSEDISFVSLQANILQVYNIGIEKEIAGKIWRWVPLRLENIDAASWEGRKKENISDSFAIWGL